MQTAKDLQGSVQYLNGMDVHLIFSGAPHKQELAASVMQEAQECIRDIIDTAVEFLAIKLQLNLNKFE